MLFFKESMMSRKRKNHLRAISEDEYAHLEKISRSLSEPSTRVARAKALLAVSQNFSYQEAAAISGRRSAQAVSQLVGRFNQEGMAALDLKHGGGPEIVYGPEIKNKILEIISTPPDRKKHGTANWSLSMLQKHLEKTEIGHVSTYTLWKILHSANYSFQKNRTWIKTGIVNRRRGGKVIEVEDPDAEAKKKSDFSSL